LKKKYILSTVHRAENTDDLERLKNITEALNEINEEIQVVLPLHPRTKAILEKNKIETKFTIIEPVGYLEMVYLIKNSELIMTDSGGLQKEAFFFEKPCITMRDETEWIELIENGFNVLVGANKGKIIETYKNADKLFNNDYAVDLYGGGEASKRIVEELLKN
jgi:UDP-GlcNAc3NAcA epimerase